MNNYNLPLEVKSILHKAKKERQTMVLVTGVFDVLHREHVRFLQKAKKAGDILLIGVETDRRVRILKGSDRPINNERSRMQVLDQLGIADSIFLLPVNFDDLEDHKAFIRLIKPDVLAVSSHSPHLEVKRKIVKDFGCQLSIVHQHNPEISSSKIIKQRSNN